MSRCDAWLPRRHRRRLSPSSDNLEETRHSSIERSDDNYGCLSGRFYLALVKYSYPGRGEARTAIASILLSSDQGLPRLLTKLEEIKRKLQFWTRGNAFQKIVLTELRPMGENENRPVVAQSGPIGRKPAVLPSFASDKASP